MSELTANERKLARKHYALGVDSVLMWVKEIIFNRKRYESGAADVFAELESLAEIMEPDSDWRSIKAEVVDSVV